MFELKRSFTDRRSGKDRRRLLSIRRFHYKGPERRASRKSDRRYRHERRKSYVRVSRWSSVKLKDLKISKYLQPH